MQAGQIQELELRRLLHELKDKRPDICIRFRLLGEMWQPSFAKVAKITAEGVVLFDEQTDKATEVRDLREIVQFELDGRYHNYHPHHHYTMEQVLNITERHANSRS